jgi:hypothetical protein
MGGRDSAVRPGLLFSRKQMANFKPNPWNNFSTTGISAPKIFDLWDFMVVFT